MDYFNRFIDDTIIDFVCGANKQVRAAESKQCRPRPSRRHDCDAGSLSHVTKGDRKRSRREAEYRGILE